MIAHTPDYQLPDQGFTVVRWAHDLARGGGAVVVEAEVERIRRPDGALTIADLSRFKTVKDGPLFVLRKVLELEAEAVRRWSKDGFARFHKRSAGRQVEAICHERGVEAAVSWALANGARERLDLGRLREMLGASLYTADGFDPDVFRAELARCLQERRRQRGL